MKGKSKVLRAKSRVVKEFEGGKGEKGCEGEIEGVEVKIEGVLG